MRHLKLYKLFKESNNYIQDKIDSILDKISNSGIDSLSTGEINLLDSYKDGDELSELAYDELNKKDDTNNSTNDNDTHTITINFDDYQRALKEKEREEEFGERDNIDFTVDDWLIDAKSSHIEDNIIKFIKMNPTYLMKYKPRTWEVLSNSIKKANSESDIENLFSALISPEVAKEYINQFY